MANSSDFYQEWCKGCGYWWLVGGLERGLTKRCSACGGHDLTLKDLPKPKKTKGAEPNVPGKFDESAPKRW